MSKKRTCKPSSKPGPKPKPRPPDRSVGYGLVICQAVGSVASLPFCRLELAVCQACGQTVRTVCFECVKAVR
jgi:hypothetical protein